MGEVHIEDLFRIADLIGLSRRHFQNGSFPHFDLSLGYRLRAIGAGAVEVDRRGLVTVMRTYRERLNKDPEELERLRALVRLHG